MVVQTYYDCTYSLERVVRRGMQPDPNYMASVQKGKLQPFMRRMVYEWNLEVADHQLRLTNQALLLGFNYFDRYMSLIPCPKTKLQLVSTACLWVASKVCANECPVAKAEQLERLIGVHRKDVVEMERWLLCGLKFDVMPVTVFDVVHLLLPFVFCDREQRPKLIQYVENISLVQVRPARRKWNPYYTAPISTVILHF